MTFAESLGQVAPVYNLALVVIVVILFINLFKIKTKAYIYPWRLLFIAVSIFIVEELITVFKIFGFISFPRAVNPLFEMAIITLFIYMLLLQKKYNTEYLK